MTTPFPFEPIEEDSPQIAYQRVLKSVGCDFLRDAYDQEVLRQMQEGIGTFGKNGIINSPEDMGGWPVLKAGKVLKDSDGDGMPDKWERKHGLNPKDETDASGYKLDKGYTNIEVYLKVHWFSHRSKSLSISANTNIRSFLGKCYLCGRTQ